MRVFDLSDFQPSNRLVYLTNNYSADGFILKIGESISGKQEEDAKFKYFVEDARDLEVPLGVYFVSHAKNDSDFLTEANWINDKLYETFGEELPKLGIWWDMEVPSVKRTDVWPQLRDIIGTMESWYNSMHIGIYAQYSYFYDYLDLSELKYYAIPIWVAQYEYHENSLKVEHPELSHVGWQHSETFEGLSQDVNEWYGFKD